MDLKEEALPPDSTVFNDEAVDVFIRGGVAAANEHLRLWGVVRKLIERDIVNGKPTSEIAKSISLLQAGEAAYYNLYQH